MLGISKFRGLLKARRFCGGLFVETLSLINGEIIWKPPNQGTKAGGFHGDVGVFIPTT